VALGAGATDLEGAGGELDADGGLGLEAELVAGESGEDVGLPDAGVADEHDLEEVVVLVVHPVRHRPAPPAGSCSTHAKIHPMRRGRGSDAPPWRTDGWGAERFAGIARAYLGFGPWMDRLGAGGAGEVTTPREETETKRAAAMWASTTR
jgi:hypothetical protein